MIRWVLAIALLILAFNARASTMPGVEVRAWLEPAQELVVLQQVNLHIEVASRTWFTGGTRIQAFEVPGAMVLQREQFATNSTRRVNGETWSVQLWSLTLYPQREGRFTVPAIKLSVSIAGHDGRSLKGEVVTQPLAFEAVVPAALFGKQGWVATETFTVRDSFERLPRELKPGDAIKRTLVFEAGNVAAMMLPSLQEGAAPGLGVYTRPPHIEDSVNRGTYRARRTEVITYVIEKPGQYSLPARQYLWWNLAERRVERIELPARVIATTGYGRDGDYVGKGAENKVRPVYWGTGLGEWAGVLLIVLALVGLWRWQSRKGEVSERELLQSFIAHYRRGDKHGAVRRLYAWLDRYALPADCHSARRWLSETGGSNEPLREAFNRFMQAVYTETGVQSLDAQKLTTLLKGVQQSGKGNRWHRPATSFELN